MSAGRSFEDRFWAKVEKTDTCWQWKGSLANQGYGRIRQAPVSKAVHRVAWELLVGPIPDEMQVDHKCHNRGCVNPDHLRVVTRKQNMENRAGAPVTSKSGVRGVIWHEKSQRWHAYAHQSGRTIWVGSFTTIEDAEAAVIELRNSLFTHNELDRRRAS